MLAVLFHCLSVVSFTIPGQNPILSDKPPTHRQPQDGRVYHSLEIRDPGFGHRNVSYFVTDTGLAILDGDIIYGPVEKLLAHRANDSVDGLSCSFGNPWPSATVMYKYIDDATETELKDLVNTAIARWRSVASYLTFAKLINSDAPTPGVVTIRQRCGAFNCHASLGYSSDALHVWLCKGQCDASAATHEFGHILGDSPRRPCLAASLCALESADMPN